MATATVETWPELRHYMYFGSPEFHAEHKRYGPLAQVAEVDSIARFSVTAHGGSIYPHCRSFRKVSIAMMGDGEFTDAPDNSQLVLFYLPRFVCKVGTEKFYSLRSAVEYAQQYITEKTATIEMLIGDYSIRASSDAVTIPEGYNLTITTAQTDYEGEGTAVSGINDAMDKAADGADSVKENFA